MVYSFLIYIFMQYSFHTQEFIMGVLLICSHRPLQMTHLVAVLTLWREYAEPKGIRIARQRVRLTAGRKI